MFLTLPFICCVAASYREKNSHKKRNKHKPRTTSGKNQRTQITGNLWQVPQSLPSFLLSSPNQAHFVRRKKQVLDQHPLFFVCSKHRSKRQPLLFILSRSFAFLFLFSLCCEDKTPEARRTKDVRRGKHPTTKLRSRNTCQATPSMHAKFPNTRR